MIEISKEARKDIIEIYLFGANQFGASQAERYQDGLLTKIETLAALPALWRPLKTTKSEYFRVNYQSHAIYFRNEDKFRVMPS